MGQLLGERSRGLLPVSFVAIAAVFYSLMPGRSPSSPGKASSGAEETTFSQGQSPDRADDPLSPLRDSLEGAACGEGGSYQVDFLIATVPDPIDSHLAPLFDRALDAIQQGLQDSLYVLDRFSLPWKAKDDKGWKVSWETKSGLTATKLNGGDVQKKMPGTMVFRSGHRLQIVFVVGEAPTFGIQRRAFDQALQTISHCEEKRLQCVSRCGGGRIRILGPYFSGSVASLATLISSWNAREHARFTLISGSATSTQNAYELDSRNNPELHLGDVEFRSTVIPDAILKLRMEVFLVQRFGPDALKSVAYFQDGTSYGEDSSAPQTRSNRRSDSGSRTTTSTSATGELLIRPRFRMSFPLNVAQSARHTSRATRAPQARSGSSQQRPRGSPSTHAGAAQDIVPAQDPRTATNIADLVLDSQIETLRRSGVPSSVSSRLILGICSSSRGR